MFVIDPLLTAGVQVPLVTEDAGTLVRLAAENVGVPYRALGIVPDVRFDADKFVKSGVGTFVNLADALTNFAISLALVIIHLFYKLHKLLYNCL